MRWFWMDRYLEFESRRRAVAVKNITLAEDHLHQNFPGFPVMPHSLVIEGLAQTGGLLACENQGFHTKVVLAKVPRMTFYSPVLPGDSLIYTTTIQHISEEGSRVTATSHRGDELQAEGEIVFAHLREEQVNARQIDDGVLLHTMRMLRLFEVGRTQDGSPLKDPNAK